MSGNFTEPPLTVQPTLALLGIDLNVNLGAILAGVLISSCLYGTMVTQAYNYFVTSWKSDTMWLRAFVVSLCFLETGHTVFICHGIYSMAITNWGVIPSLNDIPWTLKATIMWSSLVGAWLQLFLANRIRVLSKRWEIFILIHTLVWLRIALGIFATTRDLESHSLPDFQAKFKWLLTTLMVLIVVIDTTNALSLTYLLNKSRSGLVKSNAVIDSMIVFSIESGLVTSICTIAMLICYLTMPNGVWIAVFVIIAKNYSNSILISLNSRTKYRKDLRYDTEKTNPSFVKMEPLKFKSNPSVEVSTMVTTMGDGENNFSRNYTTASNEDFEKKHSFAV